MQVSYVKGKIYIQVFGKDGRFDLLNIIRISEYTYGGCPFNKFVKRL